MGPEDLDDLIEHVLHVEASDEDNASRFDVESFWNVVPFESF